MALRHFNAYAKFGTAAQILDAQNAVNAGQPLSNQAAAVAISNDGRGGARALTFSSAGGTLQWPLEVGIAHGAYVAFGIDILVVAITTSTQQIAMLVHSLSTVSTHWGLGLHVLADGRLALSRSGTLLATSAATVVPGGRYYIEVEGELRNTAVGWAKLFMDGVEILSVTNVQTAPSTAAAQMLRLATANSFGTSNIVYTSEYVLDASGDASELFKARTGPWQVATLVGVEDIEQSGTVVGAASAHAATSELTPDEDTSYVELDTAGEKVLLRHTNGLATSGPVALRGFGRFRKSTEGTMGVRLVQHRAGAEHQSPLIAPPTTYRTYVGAIRSSDPVTGNALDAATANALRLGAAAATS